MDFVLAYDFGTGGIKASLFDETGALVASGFDAYETAYPAAGFHEQRPADWWRATVASTRKLVGAVRPEQVAAIRALGIGCVLGIAHFQPGQQEHATRGTAGFTHTPDTATKG